MKLVIDIPEEEYNIIKNYNAPMTWAEHLIAKGTPLPKGHGRLIDADKIATHLEEMRDGWNYYGDEYEAGRYQSYDNALDEVVDAPTIIKEDTKSEV